MGFTIISLQSFHMAGDGKLGGLVDPNDGQCHLNTSGFYDWSTVQGELQCNVCLEWSTLHHYRVKSCLKWKELYSFKRVSIRMVMSKMMINNKIC